MFYKKPVKNKTRFVHSPTILGSLGASIQCLQLIENASRFKSSMRHATVDRAGYAHLYRPDSGHGYRSSWYGYRDGPTTLAPYGCHIHPQSSASQTRAGGYGSSHAWQSAPDRSPAARFAEDCPPGRGAT